VGPVVPTKLGHTKLAKYAVAPVMVPETRMSPVQESAYVCTSGVVTEFEVRAPFTKVRSPSRLLAMWPAKRLKSQTLTVQGVCAPSVPGALPPRYTVMSTFT
jgi:hypothetical protein